MEQLNTIKELINQGNVEQAIQMLDEVLQTDFPGKDEAYYLRGNAYRKKGNWQQALNNYQYAIDLNPEGPALHAHQMVMDILNFYNKDMFNQ
ncbi:tetratricopeptide repeat protein [uncultured Bacteroides sp.]|uniref:tetratricopeptide repeat protein n=1 Tax=uncultured Bacteroides sp. TaxID=162156 RepID=UPI0025D9EE9A|nr:tetratricopeptide repeat protein [uncultured Bacteroides sp.]